MNTSQGLRVSQLDASTSERHPNHHLNTSDAPLTRSRSSAAAAALAASSIFDPVAVVQPEADYTMLRLQSRVKNLQEDLQLAQSMRMDDSRKAAASEFQAVAAKLLHQQSAAEDRIRDLEAALTKRQSSSNVTPLVAQPSIPAAVNDVTQQQIAESRAKEAQVLSLVQNAALSALASPPRPRALVTTQPPPTQTQTQLGTTATASFAHPIALIALATTPTPAPIPLHFPTPTPTPTSTSAVTPAQTHTASSLPLPSSSTQLPSDVLQAAVVSTLQHVVDSTRQEVADAVAVAVSQERARVVESVAKAREEWKREHEQELATAAIALKAASERVDAAERAKQAAELEKQRSEVEKQAAEAAKLLVASRNQSIQNHFTSSSSSSVSAGASSANAHEVNEAMMDISSSSGDDDVDTRYKHRPLHSSYRGTSAATTTPSRTKQQAVSHGERKANVSSRTGSSSMSRNTPRSDKVGTKAQLGKTATSTKQSQSVMMSESSEDDEAYVDSDVDESDNISDGNMRNSRQVYSGYGRVLKDLEEAATRLEQSISERKKLQVQLEHMTAVARAADEAFIRVRADADRFQVAATEAEAAKAKAEAAVTTAQAECEVLKARAAETRVTLEGAAKEASEKAAGLENEVKSYKVQLTSMKNVLETTELKLSSAENKVEALERKVALDAKEASDNVEAMVKLAVEKTRQDCTTLMNKTVEGHSATIASLQQSVSSLSADLEATCARAEILDGELATVRKECESLRIAVSQHESHAHSLQTTLVEVGDRAVEAERRAQETEARALTSEVESQTLRATVEELKVALSTTVEASERVRHEARKEIDAARQEAAAIRAAFAQDTGRLENTIEMIRREKQGEIDRARDDIAALEAEKVTDRARIEQLVQALATWEARGKSLEDALTVSKRLSDDATFDLKRLETKMKEQDRELETRAKETASLRESLVSAEKQHQALEATHNGTLRDLRQANIQIQSLEASLAQSEQKLRYSASLLTEAEEQHKAAIKSLKEEHVQELKEQAERAKQRIQQMQEVVDVDALVRQQQMARSMAFAATATATAPAPAQQPHLPHKPQHLPPYSSAHAGVAARQGLAASIAGGAPSGSASTGSGGSGNGSGSDILRAFASPMNAYLSSLHQQQQQQYQQQQQPQFHLPSDTILQQELRRLEDLLSTRDGERQRLQVELDTTIQERDHYRKQLHDMEKTSLPASTADKLEKQIEELKIRYSQSVEEVESLGAQLSAAKEEIAQVIESNSVEKRLALEKLERRWAQRCMVQQANMSKRLKDAVEEEETRHAQAATVLQQELVESRTREHAALVVVEELMKRLTEATKPSLYLQQPRTVNGVSLMSAPMSTSSSSAGLPAAATMTMTPQYPQMASSMVRPSHPPPPPRPVPPPSQVAQPPPATTASAPFYPLSSSSSYSSSSSSHHEHINAMERAKMLLRQQAEIADRVRQAQALVAGQNSYGPGPASG